MTAGMQVAKSPVSRVDPKEHWLTVVVDAGYLQCRSVDPTPPVAGQPELVREAEIRASPSLAEIKDCAVWMVWVPVSVPSAWTEVDGSATSMAWVRKGANGAIDARPMQLSFAEGNKRRWHWGGDRRAPDGSEWRQLVSSPYCACCTHGCLPADNPEASRYGIGIEIHTRSYQPKIDWAQARVLPWVDPGEPMQVYLKSEPYLQYDNQPVQNFVKSALGGKAGRDRSPWQTALLLARAAAAQAGAAPTGEAPDMVRGLTVAGAQAFAATGQGNANDAHCLAVAAMRAVGIPARVVVGFQVIPDQVGMTFPAKLCMWGEFWVGAVGWIPFDCAEMRIDARAAATETAEIDGFGEPSNHNRRIAWSYFLAPPFKLAGPREYPAGFGMGPLFTSLDDVPDEVLVNYPQQGGAADALLSPEALEKATALVAHPGALGATARTGRGAAALWPGERPLSRDPANVRKR